MTKSELWAKVRANAGVGVPHRAKSMQLPCVHEGDVVSPCRSCGGGEARHIRECDVFGRATRIEAGKNVAVCATCERYQPDPTLLPSQSAAASGRIVVPQPPRLDLRPTKPTAVVTVASGSVGRELHGVSGPPMRAFAERVGADFVVLDWPGHPAWAISAKFAIARALEHYDRILYADADVLFRDGCVNPFDVCDPSEFGACDEMPWHLEPGRSKFGVLQNYQKLRTELDLAANVIPSWYFNLGLYVASREHLRLLAAPTLPVRPYHCGEQDLINARILEAATKVRLLDRRCNWQNWTDDGFRHAPPDAILHWSGAGSDRDRRVADMRVKADHQATRSP